MNKRIIYENDKGQVCIIIPAANTGLTVEEIAFKDVPSGKSYKIVDVSDIPSDRTNRDCFKIQHDKVVVCPNKLAEKTTRINADKSKKSELLEKLGIEEKDLPELKKLFG